MLKGPGREGREEHDRLPARVNELEAKVAEQSHVDDLQRLRERCSGTRGPQRGHPLVRRARRAIEATAADAEFRDKWFDRAMAVLATTDEPLSARVVARMTTVSDSTMRPVVQDLSKAGVVESIGGRQEQFALDREVLERRIALEDPDIDRSP